MRRDMDLIRELLLRLEGFDKSPYGVETFSPEGDEIAVEGYTPDQIAYHLNLIYEAGLVETGTKGSGMTMDGEFMFRRLTWSGHEFVDAIRSPEVWRKTKAGASAVGGWTFGILKDLSMAYLKHEAKQRLGIEI